ncbi:MAG: PAS domain-containing protein [Polyangiaceae bacterium]
MEYLAPVPAGLSRRLFGELLRNLPLALAVFDREMRYVGHNERWLALHRAPPGVSLIGRSHYEAFPWVRDEWRSAHRRGLAGETVRSEVDRMPRPGGKDEFVRWIVAPWMDDDGSIGGIAIYCEDISGEVETQRRLAERELLLRDMFEQSSVGLNLCTI